MLRSIMIAAAMTVRGLVVAFALAAAFVLAMTFARAETGLASYYWRGQMTASGERFNPAALTAAHRWRKFGQRVRVTNLRNGRSVTVRINDRGPFVRGRIIDLSRAAAQAIGMTGAGVVMVRIERTD